LAVFVRLVGEQAATTRVMAIRPAMDEAPRFQSCIDYSCRKGLKDFNSCGGLYRKAAQRFNHPTRT
jgi:hypothetical protein